MPKWPHIVQTWLKMTLAKRRYDFCIHGNSEFCDWWNLASTFISRGIYNNLGAHRRSVSKGLSVIAVNLILILNKKTCFASQSCPWTSRAESCFLHGWALHTQGYFPRTHDDWWSVFYTLTSGAWANQVCSNSLWYVFLMYCESTPTVALFLMKNTAWPIGYIPLGYFTFDCYEQLGEMIYDRLVN